MGEGFQLGIWGMVMHGWIEEGGAGGEGEGRSKKNGVKWQSGEY